MFKILKHFGDIVYLFIFNLRQFLEMFRHFYIFNFNFRHFLEMFRHF